MKTRMTAADVAAEVACLQAAGVHGMRLANVYDLNARTYLLKLNRSAGDTGEGQKVPPPLHRLRIAPSLRWLVCPRGDAIRPTVRAPLHLWGGTTAADAVVTHAQCACALCACHSLAAAVRITPPRPPQNPNPSLWLGGPPCVAG